MKISVILVVFCCLSCFLVECQNSGFPRNIIQHRYPSITQHELIRRIDRQSQGDKMPTNQLFMIHKERNAELFPERYDWEDIDDDPMNLLSNPEDTGRIQYSPLLRISYNPLAAIMHQDYQIQESENIKSITGQTYGASVSAAGLGFNSFKILLDQNVPSDVAHCVQAACAVWSTIIGVCDVPISIQISWKQLGTGVLASTGPSAIYGLTNYGMLFPDALANQLVKQDIDPTRADIRMTINSQMNPRFNKDISVAPPSGTYDLLTIVLHEIWHGLGGVGAIGRSTRNQYPYLKPIAYDAHVVDTYGSPVYQIKSKMLDTMLRNDVNKLYYRYSSNANGGFNPSVVPSLYFPGSFSPGSSIYHLSESKYTTDLLTPFLNTRERDLTVGFKGINILKSLGWNLRECSEYASSCAVCTSADCVWCNGDCLESDSFTEECTDSGSMITTKESCPGCTQNSDCDDPLDMCSTGVCIIDYNQGLTGYCSWSSRLDCSNQDPCTTVQCDSSMGCIHHYNTPECDTSGNICSADGGLSGGYFCRVSSGERVSIDSTMLYPYVSSRYVLSITVGIDIPKIPAGFFIKGSSAIAASVLNFNWCSSDNSYVQFFRESSVAVNTTSEQISNLFVSYFHLCSPVVVSVPQSSGGKFTRWNVEMFLSTNSKLTTTQKSSGYLGFRFSDEENISGSRIYVEVIPRIVFTQIKTLKQVVLDYSVPTGYYMPFITLLDGTLADMYLPTFFNSYVMQIN